MWRSELGQVKRASPLGRQAEGTVCAKACGWSNMARPGPKEGQGTRGGSGRQHDEKQEWRGWQGLDPEALRSFTFTLRAMGSH